MLHTGSSRVPLTTAEINERNGASSSKMIHLIENMFILNPLIINADCVYIYPNVKNVPAGNQTLGTKHFF